MVCLLIKTDVVCLWLCRYRADASLPYVRYDAMVDLFVLVRRLAYWFWCLSSYRAIGSITVIIGHSAVHRSLFRDLVRCSRITGFIRQPTDYRLTLAVICVVVIQLLCYTK